MWIIMNGGIGTYIKALSENNADIGDKSNDNLRCDAGDIRLKVICEGEILEFLSSVELNMLFAEDIKY